MGWSPMSGLAYYTCIKWWRQHRNPDIKCHTMVPEINIHVKICPMDKKWRQSCRGERVIELVYRSKTIASILSVPKVSNAESGKRLPDNFTYLGSVWDTVRYFIISFTTDSTASPRLHRSIRFPTGSSTTAALGAALGVVYHGGARGRLPRRRSFVVYTTSLPC